MRAFIYAIILLSLASILIIANCSYISKTTDELLSLLDDGSDIYIIEEKWKKSRGIISLSTSHDNIFKIDSLIESASFFKSRGDEQCYRYALTLIKGPLGEIKSFEKLSLFNII